MNIAFQKILDEYHQLTQTLSAGGSVDIAKLGKRQAELEPIVSRIKNYELRIRELAGNKKLLDDSSAEIKSLALDECRRLEAEILKLEAEIETELLPQDENNDKNLIMEIRAGAGGDEATLFAAEMFRAYSKFAEAHQSRAHILSNSRSGAGGFKEIIFEIKSSRSPKPFALFKYESGVHRVQRVPQTEKSGRVHTSTITVAVLPELEEKDFHLDAKDLKIEATTSSGHGGQSVNTTYSAIRITHLPTGITAQCQDERSQAQNKEKALAVIRSRVAAHFREIEDKKLRAQRKGQIGTGDRSEKIRTYNFPQDRVTDHRINQNFNQINLIMEGKFGELVETLQKADLQMKKENLKV